MTTDTFPKLATRTAARSAACEVVINGFCKGAGMIAAGHGDDAVLRLHRCRHRQRRCCRRSSPRAADRTFNCVTIDGDTSTSDTLLTFATGAARRPAAARASTDAGPIRASRHFAAALHDLLRELAILVAKDGEGITKFVTIEVEGAEDDRAARRIGLSIGNSPLVKTAIAGEDANWGRVVMAVGKSGEAADRDRLSIWFGDILVAQRASARPATRKSEVARYMKGAEITLRVDVGVGKGRATVWTCDLTHGYIDINADYRSLTEKRRPKARRPQKGAAQAGESAD